MHDFAVLLIHLKFITIVWLMKIMSREENFVEKRQRKT